MLKIDFDHHDDIYDHNDGYESNNDEVKCNKVRKNLACNNYNILSEQIQELCESFNTITFKLHMLNMMEDHTTLNCMLTNLASLVAIGDNGSVITTALPSKFSYKYGF